MLQSLHIKNYAIIESLEIDLSKGLNIITGETGAGKSIILGALGLIMGKRSDSKVLFDKTKKCSVEGQFGKPGKKISNWLKENDLDEEDALIVRREINNKGKSRAFVNDTPVNLSQLQALNRHLIELHQQFDNLDIGKPSFQLEVLDIVAKNEKQVQQYQESYKEYYRLSRELEQLKSKNSSRTKEMEFLRFQLQEFDSVKLLEGEQEAAETELKKVSNAGEIQLKLQAVLEGISTSENNASQILNEAKYALQSIASFDASLGEVSKRLEAVNIELDDLSNTLSDIASGTESDPGRQAELESRLDIIYRLQNKHQASSLEELQEMESGMRSQLNAFEQFDVQTEDLEEQIATLKKAILLTAQKLTKSRKSACKKVENQTLQLLQELGMQEASLKIAIEVRKEPGPTGMDDIAYLFASNKGSEHLPLKSIASGGELSRVSLAIKSIIAGTIELPTLVFDEIDTGISGAVALKMGIILQDLAKNHQIISITHSPQVASRADAHYLVFKQTEVDRTRTMVKSLDGDERVTELAKMLSGDPPSVSAIKNAEELIKL